MRTFKLPLIVTAVVIPVMVIAAVGTFLWLNGLDISNREKAERAEKLGAGIATMGCILIAPFWLIAAAKFGRQRREQMLKKRR